MRYKDFCYIPPQNSTILEVERSGYFFAFEKSLESEQKANLIHQYQEQQTLENFQKQVDNKEDNL